MRGSPRSATTSSRAGSRCTAPPGAATPEVDEVVAGARDRTTLLSATLLDCARRGEVLPQYAAWVRALGTDAEPAAVRALHAVGATSGAGLHAGGRLALDELREAA